MAKDTSENKDDEKETREKIMFTLQAWAVAISIFYMSCLSWKTIFGI